MRIAVDLTPLADHLSGLERYAMNIVKEMVLMDHQNHYVLLFKKEVCEQLECLTKLKHVTVRVYPVCNKLIFSQIKLPFYLYREKQIDKYLFFAFPCPILFRGKGIYTLVADMVAFDCPETMKKKARIFFKYSILHSWKVSEKIVTISEFSKERILAHLVKSDSNTQKATEAAEKILLAYCGISEDFAKREPVNEAEQKRIRKDYSLPKRYFLSLSTLEPRKNLPLLVKAYGDILKEAEKSDNVPTLVLAGRCGWMMDELLDDINTHYPDKIIVTGFISDEDLPEVYRMADLFVFPTLYEGFGMPPLEARAVGTPVISSDAACMKEVLGQQAVFFESNNRQQLKQRLQEHIEKTTNGSLVTDNQNDAGPKTSFTDERFDWKRSAKVVLREMER